MGLKLTTLLALSILGVGSASAYTDENYLTIKKVTVHEISTDILNQEKLELLEQKNVHPVNLPEKGIMYRAQNVGQVIAVAKELVALGEKVYELVNKGRPVVSTSYAPITVLPKSNGMVVDVLDTENWRMPVSRTYKITYENLYGMDVVTFRYKVIFAYGGSYNGKGAYVTSAQIVPETVSVNWGFNFTANMKLGGIQNHGTKERPVAGAIMQMEYTVSNILKSDTTVDSYHVTGTGGFREL